MNHCLLLLRLRWKTRLYQGSLRAKAQRVHVFTVFAIINTGRQCESAVHLRIKNLFESSRLHRFHRRDASECCYGPVMCSTPTFTLVLWSELNLVSKFRRGYGVTEYKKLPFSINKSWKQCKMGTWTVWTVMHVTVCCSDRPCDVCATMTWLQVVRHSETPRGLHVARRSWYLFSLSGLPRHVCCVVTVSTLFLITGGWNVKFDYALFFNQTSREWKRIIHRVSRRVHPKSVRICHILTDLRNFARLEKVESESNSQQNFGNIYACCYCLWWMTVRPSLWHNRQTVGGQWSSTTVGPSWRCCLPVSLGLKHVYANITLV